VDEARWKRTADFSREGGGNFEFDPDAPHRTNKQLEEDDQVHPSSVCAFSLRFFLQEDEDRLSRAVWQLVRAGKLKEAQQLCRDSGQYWRAASLAGEAVSHDSFLTLSDERPLGNSTRALWFEAASVLAAQVPILVP